MESIDFKLLKLISQNNENKALACGYICGVLTNKIEMDDELFCFIYNILDNKSKESLFEYLKSKNV